MSACNPKATGGNRSRKMKGGNGYGFGGAIAPGAAIWAANNTSAGAGDTPMLAPAGGRRRKSRKTKRGVRRRRRNTRKMKGGLREAVASTGFAGTGVRGMADYVPVGGVNPMDVVPRPQ